MQVQIRPWNLTDSDYIMDHTQPIDPRKTIFIGGVPRPLKAAELGDIFNSRYGNVGLTVTLSSSTQKVSECLFAYLHSCERSSKTNYIVQDCQCI